MKAPSPNGTNGRDAGGRFAKGNLGGPGNPFARRVAQLRAVIVESVTDADLAAVVRTLIDAAKGGEPWAVKELLDRCIGKPAPGPTTDQDDGDLIVDYVVRIPGVDDNVQKGGGSSS